MGQVTERTNGPRTTSRPASREPGRLGDGVSCGSPGEMDYQYFTRTNGVELWQRVDAAHRRFAQLVSEVDPATPAADSVWTAHQVAAHVLAFLGVYTERDLRRRDGLADDATSITALNDAQMRSHADLSSAELIEAIGLRIDRIKALLPTSQDLGERFPFHCDVTMDAAGLLGNLVSEFLVHGRDVARGSGHSFAIDRRDAMLVLNCLLQVPAGFMRRDAHPVRLGLRIRDAVPWMIDMRPGTATSRPRLTREATDVVLSGSPTALVLALHGRYSIVEAVRRGLVPTGGRRPWRAVWVPGNIDSP
jgi:hypothetical protein